MRGLAGSALMTGALAIAVPAAAQLTPTGSRVEVSAGVAIIGPTAFDTVASAAAPTSASPLSSLDTASRIDPGLGIGAVVSVHLGGPIWAAAEAAWSRAA